MDIAAAQRTLSQKQPPNLYDVVDPVLKNAELRRVLVEGSFDKNETLRYNCVRVLFRAMDREPQLFYPYWEILAEKIDSPNGFHRSAAAQAIAYLTPVDIDCRLDHILKRYLALLDDPKVMVAHYFIETLDRIYRARQDLHSRVISTLLSIDRTAHTLERRELLKADILGVFERIFELLPSKDRKGVVAFAETCVESRCGKTRKAARSFLAARQAVHA